MNYQEIIEKCSQLSLYENEEITDLYHQEIKANVNNKIVLMDLIEEKDTYLVFLYYKDKFSNYPNLEEHLENLICNDLTQTLIKSINFFDNIEKALIKLNNFSLDTIEYFINEINR